MMRSGSFSHGGEYQFDADSAKKEPTRGRDGKKHVLNNIRSKKKSCLSRQTSGLCIISVKGEMTDAGSLWNASRERRDGSRSIHYRVKKDKKEGVVLFSGDCWQKSKGSAFKKKVNCV